MVRRAFLSFSMVVMAVGLQSKEIGVATLQNDAMKGLSVESDNKDVIDIISKIAAPPAPPKEEEKPRPKSKPAPDQIFTAVDEKAVYPGGDGALLLWISANIKYPTMAKEEGIEGTVFVQFVVEKDGSIGMVKIARGKHKDLDAEAVCVVKKIPKKFTPAKVDGQVVRSWFTIPVRFRLQK